jgi:hypothetical protein|tara:strand:+ start:691 stop:1698 length:1008 start_codon:yes stop_codon:yes gene_type:complete
MSKSLKEIWAELASLSNSQEGIRRLRLEPDHFKVYAGWSTQIEQPALILEIVTASLPTDIEFPQSTGFSVSTTSLVPGRSGVVRIVIEALDDRFRDLFPVLIQDIYEYIILAANEIDMVRRTVSRLNHWQVFLKRHRHVRLSETEQIGLWGELWFLHSRLIQQIGIEAAINSWQGPEGRNQDFEFNGTAIEVKTTAASPHEKLHISNARQLESAGLDNLYLYHIALVVHRESGLSLPGLIADIRQLVQANSTTLESFNEQLFQTGYLESKSSWYEKTGYHVLSQNAYRIEAGFPRIALDDILEGVGDVKFSVVLSACSEYRVNPDPFSSGEDENA